MATPQTNSHTIRRSRRQSIPSSRAQQYIYERELKRQLFPSVGDEISVKWVLKDRVVWWPATVRSIQSRHRRSQKCSGVLLYHNLEDYDEVQTPVTFSTSSSQRFVTSIDLGSDQKSVALSSWIYFDENLDESEETSDVNAGDIPPASVLARRTSSNNETSSQSHSTQIKRGKKFQRVHSHPRISKSIHKRKPSICDNSSILNNEGLNSEVQGEEPSQVTVVDTGVESNNMGIRLLLIERRLEDANTIRHPNLSASTFSVIVSLRWALLRALEKPLKTMLVPGLAQHGLACHVLSVTSQCDYYTFREIAAALSKEHQCSSDDPSNSRVAFSPAFHTTQSGSSASNNINILFSCLADLTSFLRIRDDIDFEAILSKEVVTDTSTLLRILGTAKISNTVDTQDSYIGNGITEVTVRTESTNSVSASSEHLPVIRLFVGSSPVSYRPVPKTKAVPTITNNSVSKLHQSTIIEQECRHFCSSLKCYRMPWKSIQIDTNLSVNCSFHLDGTVQISELKNYFVLNWTRQPAPSSVKWTRDIHDVGNNTPGCLRLSVPTVFFTASRNVRSLVSILDDHIETFMKVRSQLHNLSSFR